MKNIMVTGGAGFIGSNFVIYMLDKYPTYDIIVYDKLTYAGNLENLLEVAEDPRYHFVQGDICDAAKVDETIAEFSIDTIVNFAAETHVDRSILAPDAFIQTGVYGTYVLVGSGQESWLALPSNFHRRSVRPHSGSATPAWKQTSSTRAVRMPPARPAAICSSTPISSPMACR